MSMLDLLKPDTVTRTDVRVSRAGWVTHKAHDVTIGLIREDTGPAGNTIWRAQAGDVSGWAHTRTGAVEDVIELHNMQEKARAYDRIAPRLSRLTEGV